MASKESLKSKVAQAGEELRETGQMVLHAPALIRGAECGIRFFLGAVLSGAEIFGGYAPFGMAMVGASVSGLDGFSALLGACLGYLSFQGFTGGLRYVAACVLTFSVAFAFYDTTAYRRAWFMPVVTAAMGAATGVIYLSERGFLSSDTVYFLTEVLLSGAGVLFFRTALSPWTEKRELPGLSARQLVGLLILSGCLLIALTRVELYGGISVGRLCAALLVMCLARQGGLGVGAAVGVAVGLAMDLSSQANPFYGMAYGFAGLMTGVFSRQGKLPCALAYVLSNAVSALWVWSEGLPISSFYEVFIASVLFLLLPARFFRWVGVLTVREGSGSAAERAQAHLRRRLEDTAEAFKSVQETLRTAFAPRSNDGDAALIFDRTADKVCRSCALRTACWQRDYVTTYNALNDALPAMLERGRGEAGDFPGHFSARCLKFAEFLSTANEELTALLCRREYRNRLRESRETVSHQYADLSAILGAAAAELSSELTPDPQREKRLRQHLAALGLEGEAAVYYDSRGRLRAELEGRDLETLASREEKRCLEKLLGMPLRRTEKERTQQGERLVFVQAEPLTALAGAAAVTRDGETVSGDTGAWFKREDGALFLLLCDGMGTGPEAGRESGLAVRLLEQFLQAGVETGTALKTVSSALALRGEEEGGFTTIDLLQVDLFTGEGRVYKYGAAPTYLRQRGKVTKVTGAALPAGLIVGEPPQPDQAHFRLEGGDWVVLISDGITGQEDDLWLRELLEGEYQSPRELARAVLEESAARVGAADDRTVLALRLERREKF